MIVTSILAKNSENFELQMFASIFSARGVLYAMSKSKTHNCGCNNTLQKHPFLLTDGDVSRGGTKRPRRRRARRNGCFRRLV